MRVDPFLEAEFPGLRVLELELESLTVRPRDPRLESAKARILATSRSRGTTLDALREAPLFRAYREFYWRVGVDPTKTRPAAEAIARRVLGGRELPTINTLVDAYNLA